MTGTTTTKLVPFTVATLILMLAFSFGDHFFHMRNGILVYHWGPLLDGQSVWVYPVFGLGSLYIVLLARFLPTEQPTVRWPALITDAVIIYIMYFVSGQVGNTHPWTLTSVVTRLWLLRLALAADNKTALLVGSLALSASGYFLEGAFSALGLFTYNHVDFFYCPLWLAAIYLHGGFALVEGAPCLRTSVPHQKLT